VVGLVTIGLFAALFTRLWYLEVLSSPQLSAAAQADEIRYAPVPAPRGTIVDRYGRVMVDNVSSDEVTVAPSDLDPAGVGLNKGLLTRLAKVLDTTESSLASTALANLSQVSPYQSVPVATGINMAQVIYLEEHSANFPGVSVLPEAIRYYPDGTTASHLLGYVGQITPSELKQYAKQGYGPGDQFGQSGVEAEYQQYLRGTPGQTKLEVDASGAIVADLGQSPPVPGDTVQLNIDLGLQKEVDTALSKEIQTLRMTRDPTHGNIFYPATGGAAVVMNVNNGHVYALASYPTYNPSVWIGGISQANYDNLTSATSDDPLLNRAIDGLYTPGSTFKLATATAALETGLMTPNTIVDDATGTFTNPACVGNTPLHNAGYEHLGPINIVSALAASDDVFFYTIGCEFWLQRSTYGIQPIQNYARMFGFGQTTGITLPGEAKGRVDSPAERQKLHQEYPSVYSSAWYPADNLEMAFGQGGTIVTPIEIADAYATFANGGTKYQPQLAADVINAEGKVVKTFKPVVTGHVPLPPLVHQTLLQGFEQAIQNPSLGTAGPTFAGFPFNIMPLAGKTGTATITHQLEPDSLFVAFGPTTNPKYVVCVVISQAGYGASGAAPVARQIYQYLIAHPVNPVKPDTRVLQATAVTSTTAAVPSTTMTTAALASPASSPPPTVATSTTTSSTDVTTTAAPVSTTTTTSSPNTGSPVPISTTTTSISRGPPSG
jgi:penicillin-binding protein 2